LRARRGGHARLLPDVCRDDGDRLLLAGDRAASHRAHRRRHGGCQARRVSRALVPMRTVDVGVLLDEGRSSRYQKLLVGATALAIILDGVDTQLLGNAIPALLKDWSLPRGAFTTVLALGPLGMMVGGAIGGVLGDRVGRRTALLTSVLSFAAFTFAIAAVNGVPMLGLFRFLSGLGLGGAMPNAAALASEYVPRRQRAFAVTLTIVCFPLGGMLAASMAGQVLPLYGWRVL